jgi:hypothetical protein
MPAELRGAFLQPRLPNSAFALAEFSYKYASASTAGVIGAALEAAAKVGRISATLRAVKAGSPSLRRRPRVARLRQE